LCRAAVPNSVAFCPKESLPCRQMTCAEGLAALVPIEKWNLVRPLGMVRHRKGAIAAQRDCSSLPAARLA
jgi:hypothetical protein